MARRKATQSKVIQAPHWDTHETVLIRSLTGDDFDWINDRMAVVDTTNVSAGAADMQMKLGTAQRLTIIRGIDSWTFTDENNNPMPWPPLSRNESDNLAICQQREQILKSVFPEDRLFIYNAINALNQPMSEEEKKDSSTPAVNGFSASIPTLLSAS